MFSSCSWRKSIETSPSIELPAGKIVGGTWIDNADVEVSRDSIVGNKGAEAAH